MQTGSWTSCVESAQQCNLIARCVVVVAGGGGEQGLMVLTTTDHAKCNARK